MKTYKSVNISIAIECPVEKAYDFISEPKNLTLWAAGLADKSLTKIGEEWVTHSPMGIVKIRFVDKNPFGVVDHYVTLPTGQISYNPLRIVKNNQGSEVIFTLFRMPEAADESFALDRAMVQKDLEKLKSILES